MFLAYYVYNVLLVVLMFLAYQYAMTSKRGYAYMIIVIFTLVIGLRYHVGDDYLSYKAFFSNPKLFPKMEYGFTNICKFFHHMEFHYSTIFLLVACLEIYFFVRTFQKFKFTLPWAFFFLFTTLELFIWNNALRQSVAFCIFMYSIRYIHERRLIPFAILIVLAGSVHKTAYPLGVFYFLLNLKVKDGKVLQYSLFFATFVMGALLKDFIFANLGTFAGVIGFGETTNNMDYLKTLDWSNSKNSMGIATLIWLTLDVMVIWMYDKLKNMYSHVGFELYYKLYFIGILLQNCIGGTYLDRVNMYFLPFRIVIYSFFMYELAKNKDVLFRVPIIVFCTLTYALCMWAVFNHAATCSPYEFVDLNIVPSQQTFFD
ncbi:MAG: EpsG family protein [Paludibacteraceae bacterium]|nr:EpsG family protein [Paludibacteraceae bacterium]MBP5482180.1 EpsG family protein [Paludibacteraceae bacterium]